MVPLPTPCPADRIPDATGLEAFEAAGKAAKGQRVVFIAVEQQGPLWTVKAEALTALQLTVDSAVYDAVRAAVARLIRVRETPPQCAGREHIGHKQRWRAAPGTRVRPSTYVLTRPSRRTAP
ncbi:hypothetical protein [Streptomyces sp. NPDC056713]|uniref:hypothetical protein n=1 Tax=Streptomyces sp. NPDC056713 TaxID=3345921 RepID=UPI00367D6DC0